MSAPATMERRLGRFRIDNHVLRRQPDRAIAILEGCVVVRAEALWHCDMVEYMACHADFAEVPIGTEPPWYVWAFGPAVRGRKWVPGDAP